MNLSEWNATTSSWINSSELVTSMTTENGTNETGRNRVVSGSRYMYSQLLNSLTFAIASVGSIANGFVLLSLLCARQSRRKNINVFIINQTALDLLACLFLIPTIIFGGLETTSIIGKWIICLLFDTRTVLAVASYSSIFGLVVITAERYVKIVHSVIHRNHYRRWMTYAGVILPWVDGVCAYLIPAWATVAMVDGRCLVFRWPTRAMYSGYTLTMFFWHYVLPTIFFSFAYCSIIGVIRRQNRAVAPSVDTTAPTSTHRTIVQPANRASQGQPKHKGKMKVVRTMITIVVCFCVCYLPYKVYMVMVGMRAVPVNFAIFMIFNIISFLDRCINPFIYASQYEVVRRTWSPLVQFLRRGFTRKSEATVVRVEAAPAPSSLHSHPAGQELAVSIS